MQSYLAPAAAFILTLAFGVWLSRLGKPYNTLIFTIHKLSALAAVILTALPIIGALGRQGFQISPILLTVATLVCVVALFATGALMSTRELGFRVMLTIHRIAPAAAVVAAALAIYLLGAMPG